MPDFDTKTARAYTEIYSSHREQRLAQQLLLACEEIDRLRAERDNLRAAFRRQGLDELRCYGCGRTERRGHDSDCIALASGAPEPFMPGIAEPDDEKIERLEGELIDRLASPEAPESEAGGRQGPDSGEAASISDLDAERIREWLGTLEGREAIEDARRAGEKLAARLAPKVKVNPLSLLRVIGAAAPLKRCPVCARDRLGWSDDWRYVGGLGLAGDPAYACAECAQRLGVRGSGGWLMLRGLAAAVLEALAKCLSAPQSARRERPTVVHRVDPPRVPAVHERPAGHQLLCVCQPCERAKRWLFAVGRWQEVYGESELDNHRDA